jgi:hypothetical protein
VLGCSACLCSVFASLLRCLAWANAEAMLASVLSCFWRIVMWSVFASLLRSLAWANAEAMLASVLSCLAYRHVECLCIVAKELGLG